MKTLPQTIGTQADPDAVVPGLHVSRRRARDRTEVLGCEIDRLDFQQTIAVCDEAIRSRAYMQHMAINVAKLVAMQDDAQLRDIIAACDLVTADGLPVVWLSRLMGDPLPMRVAGIDLMHGLLKLSAARGYGVYVLGAKPDILQLAVNRMREQYPGLRLAGYRDGYYTDEEEAEVAAEIGRARPDILMVAMSSPRKEYFLGRYRDEMAVPFVMGVGGAIDVVAGITKRAPLIMQRLGLEWLFRLLQEPRRLSGRYFRTNCRFLLLVAGELRRREAEVVGAQRAKLRPVRVNADDSD